RRPRAVGSSSCSLTLMADSFCRTNGRIRCASVRCFSVVREPVLWPPICNGCSCPHYRERSRRRRQVHGLVGADEDTFLLGQLGAPAVVSPRKEPVPKPIDLDT